MKNVAWNDVICMQMRIDEFIIQLLACSLLPISHVIMPLPLLSTQVGIYISGPFHSQSLLLDPDTFEELFPQCYKPLN